MLNVNTSVTPKVPSERNEHNTVIEKADEKGKSKRKVEIKVSFNAQFLKNLIY